MKDHENPHKLISKLSCGCCLSYVPSFYYEIPVIEGTKKTVKIEKPSGAEFSY